MKTEELQELLISLDACLEAVEWSKGKSLAEAWSSCPRADWMLWLLGKQCGVTGWPDRKKVVLLGCLCAETALKFVPKGEDLPRKAIEAARAWCKGKATTEEVKRARLAAATYAAATYHFSYPAAYASGAYATASYSAAYASTTYADAALAASYSAYASGAAAAACAAATGATAYAYAASVSYPASYSAAYSAYAYAAECYASADAASAAARSDALSKMAEIIRQSMARAVQS